MTGEEWLGKKVKAYPHRAEPFEGTVFSVVATKNGDNFAVLIDAKRRSHHCLFNEMQLADD